MTKDLTVVYHWIVCCFSCFSGICNVLSFSSKFMSIFLQNILISSTLILTECVKLKDKQQKIKADRHSKIFK